MPSMLMVRGLYQPMTEQVQSEIGVGRAGRWCVQIDLDQDDLGADSASLVVDDRRDERGRGRAVVGYAQPRRREVGVQHLTRDVDRCEAPSPGRPNGRRFLTRAASVMGRAYRRCKVPLVSAPLDLAGDVVELLRALIDIESVSGQRSRNRRPGGAGAPAASPT